MNRRLEQRPKKLTPGKILRRLMAPRFRWASSPRKLPRFKRRVHSEYLFCGLLADCSSNQIQKSQSHLMSLSFSTPEPAHHVHDDWFVVRILPFAILCDCPTVLQYLSWKQQSGVVGMYAQFPMNCFFTLSYRLRRVAFKQVFSAY